LNTLWCRQIEPDLLGDHTLSMIKSWVDRCNERDGHYYCVQMEPPNLPDRVLDIGNRAHKDVKLIEHLDERIPYVALSYCWGKATADKPFLMLTKSNLEEFKVKIPTVLATSFQVIIDILRHLNIRYLWIDCLCIIQGQ
jgi:hypothetical protein